MGDAEHSDGTCPRPERGCDDCIGRVLAARRLTASAGQVMNALPLLERPAAITANAAVRITQFGEYAPPTSPGEPFAVRPGRTSLRVDTARVRGAYLSAAAPDGTSPAALHLLDPAGALVHRCHPLLPVDRMTLDGLDNLDALPPSVPAAPSVAVAAEDADDQIGRLDALLVAGGRHPSHLAHRHIDARVLAALLEHVCAVGLPVGLGVLSSAALQAVQGAVHVVERVDGVLAVDAADAALRIDAARIREAVLVRLHAVHGETSALELYDDTGRCALVVTPFGIVGTEAHEAWEHLAASLPEPA